jgi:hypothetical protein
MQQALRLYQAIRESVAKTSKNLVNCLDRQGCPSKSDAPTLAPAQLADMSLTNYEHLDAPGIRRVYSPAVHLPH